MNLDYETIEKIEILIDRKIGPKEKVGSLSAISDLVIQEITKLASKKENFIFAVMYLRYVSDCSLADSMDFMKKEIQY